jgi:UDP-3-O-[3-hydroxymyristoyl] glucosamine N-acyltransferase
VKARTTTVIFATFWNAVGIGPDEEVGPLGAGDVGAGAASVGRGETVGDHETVGAHVAVGRPVTVGGSVPVGKAVTVGRCVPVGLHVIVGLHETVGGSVTDGEGLPFAGTAEGTSLSAWRSR